MRSFVQRFEPNFPVTVGTRALWAQFGGFSVMARPPFYPHMLIVDRSGTIREEHTGKERNYYSYTNLRRLLETVSARAGLLTESLLGETTSSPLRSDPRPAAVSASPM